MTQTSTITYNKIDNKRTRVLRNGQAIGTMLYSAGCWWAYDPEGNMVGGGHDSGPHAEGALIRNANAVAQAKVEQLLALAAELGMTVFAGDPIKVLDELAEATGRQAHATNDPALRSIREARAEGIEQAATRLSRTVVSA
jgi:hypothetical protein